MSKFMKYYLLPLAAMCMAGFALFHLITAAEVLPPLPPPRVPSHTLAMQRVAGTGMVEPRSESLSLGTAQSGVVLEVYYGSDRVGTRVSKGEPLFRVDDRAWKAQLEVYRANLVAAEAQMKKLEQQPRPEDIPPLEANLKAAKAKLADAEDRAVRAEQLASAAISREEVTQRRYAYQAAKYAAEQAEKELDRMKAGAWQPDLAVARSAVEVAKANIAMVETEIERCLVRAPVEAEILQVNVREGEYVDGKGSKTLMLLGDLERLHVRVEIDEEDIVRFRSDLPAEAVLRGASLRKFPLKFIRLEPFVVPKHTLTGQGNERVDTRVLQAIYEVAPAGEKLFVGQQLDVFLELPAASPES
jgi:multidrug resistance efflux pump